MENEGINKKANDCLKPLFEHLKQMTIETISISNDHLWKWFQ